VVLGTRACCMHCKLTVYCHSNRKSIKFSHLIYLIHAVIVEYKFTMQQARVVLGAGLGNKVLR
jgi:hypothetical protein